ncbi:hypothetical protein [Alienimonas californiensis]|uniref:Uncharacterized protein n=1 Tax=Alienimonas californiensis TaxID=2527989 RepID=A0A517P717_9PLAN|nr:hypothetical protein [Alienimonas californiensis]QDT15155.1 hypothetical protein CA12_12360 [Alienimonas californiensis]
MTAHLTDELRDALAASADAPVEVEDAATHRRYVILPAAAYRSLEDAARANGGETQDGEFPSPAGYQVAAAAMADVWDDPALDEYAHVPAADDDVEVGDGDAE